MQTVKYFDRRGFRVSDPKNAKTMVECKPWDYKFYVKTKNRSFFGFGPEKDFWKFLKRSETLGSWMWPDGMIPRFDENGNEEDLYNIALNHATKIGSDWMPGLDR